MGNGQFAGSCEQAMGNKKLLSFSVSQYIKVFNPQLCAFSFLTASMIFGITSKASPTIP